MFCHKCGQKLVEGARFCSSCGEKVVIPDEVEKKALISSIKETEKTKMIEPEYEEGEDDDDYRAKIGTEVYAITRFGYVYRYGNSFGNRVYFDGIDNIPTPVYDKGSDYFDYDNEKPFIVFDYKNYMENGFMITTSNIIWRYNYGNGNEFCKCYLYDIKEVRLERVVLAQVMRIITKSGKVCKDIYLTGIENTTLFVNKFSEFIQLLNDESFEWDEEEDENVTDVEISEKEIWEICCSEKIDDIYCEIGNPLDSPKEKTARNNFDIPQDEKMFLVCDSTVLGSCKKGFAICSTGFYFAHNGAAKADWSIFKEVEMSYSLGTLYFANLSFSVANKKVYAVLVKLQEWLNR